MEQGHGEDHGELILTATDVGRSILLDVHAGKMAAAAAAPGDPADFKFEGPMEQWTRLGKGEKDLQTLVLHGRIKFRGPLAQLVPMQPELFRVPLRGGRNGNLGAAAPPDP